MAERNQPESYSITQRRPRALASSSASTHSSSRTRLSRNVRQISATASSSASTKIGEVRSAHGRATSDFNHEAHVTYPMNIPRYRGESTVARKGRTRRLGFFRSLLGRREAP
jgi:hypothetical protein